MELTPRSLRSPVSPYNQPSKPLFSAQAPGYPNSPQPESATTSPHSNRGLGLFGYSAAPPPSSVHEMPPSPQPSVMDHDYASQPPDIFSAAFDPFSGFNAASTTGMPEASGMAYYPSSSGSHLPSHRSSVSSYSSSESFSPHEPEFLPTPTVKVEDSSEWFYSPSTAHGHGHGHGRPVINSDLSPYPPTIASMSPPVDHPRCEPSWCRTYTPAYPADLHDPGDARPSHVPVIPSGSGTDPPRKRKPTTQADATHQCPVCGKLFKRSYNYKSHMETHNPQRKYPHPCTAMNGNTRCQKKFQRKTDLERHNDSVHLKTRNYQCAMCGNRFARRDTLRRHAEDGCHKRFELGFREGPAASPGQWSLTNYPKPNRCYSLAVPPDSARAPSSPAVPSTPFSHYERPEVPSSAAGTAGTVSTPVMYSS